MKKIVSYSYYYYYIAWEHSKHLTRSNKPKHEIKNPNPHAPVRLQKFPSNNVQILNISTVAKATNSLRTNAKDTTSTTQPTVTRSHGQSRSHTPRVHYHQSANHLQPKQIFPTAPHLLPLFPISWPIPLTSRVIVLHFVFICTFAQSAGRFDILLCAGSQLARKVNDIVLCRRSASTRQGFVESSPRPTGHHEVRQLYCHFCQFLSLYNRASGQSHTSRSEKWKILCEKCWNQWWIRVRVEISQPKCKFQWVVIQKCANCVRHIRLFNGVAWGDDGVSFFISH